MAAKIEHTILGEHVIDDMVMPGHVTQQTMDMINDFTFRPDDCLVACYPKAGCTWIQQIVWLIQNNGDIAGANATPVFLRARYLECVWLGGDLCIELLANDPSPRTIKTHLPFRYVQKHVEGGTFKTIVGFRNVKDMVVSNYHFYRMNKALNNFKGSFDDFFEYFKEKRLVYGDYFDHVRGWWSQENNPNVMFVFYEDLKRDLKKEVEKMSKFLGKDFSDKIIRDIVDESTFKRMKENPMTNCEDIPVFDNDISTFIRKGEVADWKNYFNEEQNKYIDKKIEEWFKPKSIYPNMCFEN